MHPSKKVQIAHWKANRALTKVLSKYVNFANVLSLKLAAELFKYTEISDYTIKSIYD